jgi:hypothetical protein
MSRSKEVARASADRRNAKLRALHGPDGIYGKQTLQKPRVFGNKLNSAAAAEYLGVTETQLAKMRLCRQVSYIKYGKECRYLVSDLEECIREHLVPAVRVEEPSPALLLS